MADFFGRITGDWIGTCDQSTDGEQADTKYFRATVSQSGANAFNTKFEYFRFDPATGKLSSIGSSTCTTTIGSDGVAQNKITGTGQILVNNTPKNQSHSLAESLKVTAPGSLQGQGTGSLRVSGMPLGLGKNGQVRKDTSTWQFSDGVLQIEQALNVKFKALIFSKSFDVKASYRATRGTDVASLITKPEKVASRPAGAAAGKTN